MIGAPGAVVVNAAAKALDDRHSADPSVVSFGSETTR
jgi:hypothetical protein